MPDSLQRDVIRKRCLDWIADFLSENSVFLLDNDFRALSSRVAAVSELMPPLPVGLSIKDIQIFHVIASGSL